MPNRCLILAPLLGFCLVYGPTAHGQFIAFNDYAPGVGTHSNTTTLGVVPSGRLKDIRSGLLTSVSVAITQSGTTPAGVHGVPVSGTPADVVFGGYVDFGGGPNPAIELDAAADFLLYTFTGLDESLEYNFQATAISSHPTYTNRWSLFEILGAASFTSAHTAGAFSTAKLPGLAVNQVVINTGDNVEGELAWWEHIRPGPGGTFAVRSKKYSGSMPGGSTQGLKGYGLTGFRLEQAPTYTGRTQVPPLIPNPEPNHINGIETVFMILMENHDWSTIKDSTYCPYINKTLLPMASYCTQYYSPPGVHPSEPNYLWLIAGTNFGIRDDGLPNVNRLSSTATLFNQLDQAGISWKTYQEDISGTNCPVASTGKYVARHNPFVFFDSVSANLDYCSNHVRPYPELAGDLTADRVARFNFISPNLTNDMHDIAAGSPSSRLQGDNWLSREVPKILASPAFIRAGALFIVWDEGTADSDGPMGMIALSPRARGGGYNNKIYYTHSSLLRTLQDIFAVQPYLADAAYAQSLCDLFKTLRLTSAKWAPDGFRFTGTNLIVGKTYVVQLASSLATRNWVSIQTNIAESVSFTFTDPNADPASPGFYRIKELP